MVEKRRLEAELSKTRSSLLKSEELMNNKERVLSPTMCVADQLAGQHARMHACDMFMHVAVSTFPRAASMCVYCHASSGPDVLLRACLMCCSGA